MSNTGARKFKRYFFPSLIVLMFLPMVTRINQDRVYQPPELHDMKCAIAIKSQDDTTKALLTGFCYEILKAYSSRSRLDMEIVLERRGENYLDSIRNNSLDIIAIPVSRMGSIDDFDFSSSVENYFVYASPEESSAGLKDFNLWLGEYLTSSEYTQLKKRFFQATGSPFRRAASEDPLNMSGPYDALIKQAAKSIDWDWRMLSALVWQESKFRIDVVSRRGAMGLMQMMPATADKMGCENIVDPEDCITTGANYINRLQNMFRPYASNRLELEKMTLAAYNAGEGRMLDCIKYAQSVGASTSRWEDIAMVIPEMNDDSIFDNDSVRLGKFKGLETIAYVDAVNDVYDAFRKICPDSAQDQKNLVKSEPISSEE